MSSSENFLKPTFMRSTWPRISFMSGPRNVIEPESSSFSSWWPSTNHALAFWAQSSWSALEIETLRSGTVTFDGCLVGSRTIPIWSGDTPHFQVHESIVATRRVGSGSSLNSKFEHNHAFCFGPILPLTSDWSPLDQRTVSASNSMSKYAASFDEPSSFGQVTPVTSAPVKSCRDIALWLK